MTDSATQRNFAALVIDDEHHVREFVASPARRTAAYHSANIELVGRSQALIEVMKQVDRVANTNLPVLLTGGSATGKEVVASAIHHHSGRANYPFIAVNCPAIPAELIEAELFGQVKGSVAAADRDQRGLWVEADGGTVFLDEVTETSPSFQLKLLRVLQASEILPVGSNENTRVDVRVIAASSRNLEQEVAAGRFRQDLFYQLNPVTIVLPALREPAIHDWVPLSEIEGRYVTKVLEHTRGNKQAAARVLGVDRKTLDRMIKRHHIETQFLRDRAKKSVFL